MAHISVLTKEVITALALTPDSVVVDCTVGVGGHATAILSALQAEGRYIGFDVDATALAELPSSIKDDARVTLINANFKNIQTELASRDITPTALVADLGWRSEQFEEGKRGFSFNADEPLQMTYGNPEDYEFTAADIVNEWAEESIADIIYGYGEERAARAIAAAIVTAREEQEIKTAKALADIVTSAVPAFRRRGRIHPATQTFQALRIAVNDELGVLKTLLEDGFAVLAPQGRMAIITFHSLEDRIVKHTFKQLTHDQKAVAVTKKPVTASREECTGNPRARSAKLRVIEKV